MLDFILDSELGSSQEGKQKLTDNEVIINSKLLLSVCCVCVQYWWKEPNVRLLKFVYFRAKRYIASKQFMRAAALSSYDGVKVKLHQGSIKCSFILLKTCRQLLYKV